MAARAYWQGHLRLSLVSFAIRLYPASVPARQIAFHQIDKKSGQRVRQQLIVPDKGPIERSDIVKGYEYEKGRYVALSDADFKHANVKASETIDIANFTDASGIPAMYFDTPYFLAPQKGGQKVYALLREALYDDLLPGERGELHIALAQELEQRCGADDDRELERASAIAGHYAAAGDQPLRP